MPTINISGEFKRKQLGSLPDSTKPFVSSLPNSPEFKSNLPPTNPFKSNLPPTNNYRRPQSTFINDPEDIIQDGTKEQMGGGTIGTSTGIGKPRFNFFKTKSEPRELTGAQKQINEAYTDYYKTMEKIYPKKK